MSNEKIVIVKYNAGNIRSVLYALGRIGVEAEVTDDHARIREADKVIFPGVGEASTAMSYLRERGLDTLLIGLRQPVLGICLGMQLMCRHSEENDTECLGIFPEMVRKFVPGSVGGDLRSVGTNPRSTGADPRSVGAHLQAPGYDVGEGQGAVMATSVLKVPQIGWNTIYDLRSPLLDGVKDGAYCYFVHGYYASLGEHTIATTDYVQPYSSGLHRDNFYGVQFHPEKSAAVGEQILRNFCLKIRS